MADRRQKMGQIAVLLQDLRTFSYQDRTVLPRLFVHYVRPHMDFAVPPGGQSRDVMLIVNCIEKVLLKMVSAVSGLMDL